MEIVLLILSLLCGLAIGAFVVYRLQLVQVKEIDDNAQRVANEKLKETEILTSSFRGQLKELTEEISSRQQELQNTIKQETAIVESVLEREKEQAAVAFVAYVDSLDLSMAQTEEEFDAKMLGLRAELDKITSTRNATISALVREKEIQEQSTFYRIAVSSADLADIEILEEVKPKLRKPEVLSKVIWTTFYQKATNTLCSFVLGDRTVCGIYKLTDTTTGLAYIGQSVDIAKRWKDHIKAALGAAGGAISNNKLYAAMKDSGVHNFTFELLEEVPSPQLNEKEKYYIGLYQSSVYGLNTVRGNG